MTMRYLTQLIGLLCFATAARADLTLIEKVTVNGNPARWVLKCKGDKARLDIESYRSFILHPDGSLVRLEHTEKLYMKIPNPVDPNLVSLMRAKASKEDLENAKTGIRVKQTGKTKEVNGWTTHEYTQNHGYQTWTYWIATDYPDYKPLLTELAPSQKALPPVGQPAGPALDLLGFKYTDLPGFPLVTEYRWPRDVNVDKTEEFWVREIQGIKKQLVDDAEFVIPDDYAESIQKVGSPLKLNTK